MKSKTSADRSPWLDNAKLVLITLVVTGHFLEVFYDESAVALYAWQLIYAFHMPAFVFLAGFYARPDAATPVFEIAKKLLIPMLVFGLIYEGGHLVFKGEFSNYARQLAPYWLLWYLLCLFIWTVSLPHLLTIRFPMAILVVLSLAVGLVDNVGYPLSLSRLLVFFPFFLMGYRFAEGKLLETAIFRNPIYLLPAFLFIAMLHPVLNAIDVNRLMLFGRASFHESQLNWYQGLTMRAELMIISTLALLSFLVLVPRTENRFTALGRNSITVFLLHGIFVGGFEYFGGAIIKQMQGWQVLAFSLVAGVVLTWLLSAAPIRRGYDLSMDAVAGLLFKSTVLKR